MKILTVVPENYKISSVKPPIKKPILLDMVNFCTILCSRLYWWLQKKKQVKQKSIHKILERSVLIGTFFLTLILRQIQTYLSVKVNT